MLHPMKKLQNLFLKIVFLGNYLRNPSLETFNFTDSKFESAISGG